MEDRALKLSDLTILIALPIILFQVFQYMEVENPIYIWDYKAYWLTWENFSQMAVHAPWHWVKANLASINGSDYNTSPISVLFPFYFIGIGSRLEYVLGLSMFYLLPIVYLTAAIFDRLKPGQSRLWQGVIVLATTAYAPFWKPILRGYPDDVGLIAIMLAILYVLRTDLTGRIRPKTILMLGILMWMPFLLRRWYAYTVVSLYMTMPFLNFMLFSGQEKSKLVQFKNVAGHFVGAGIVSIVFAIIFQLSLLRRIVGTNYSYIYSAYQTDFQTSLHYMLHDGGLYMLPFFCVGAIWSMSRTRSPAKNFCLFSAANLFISFILFTRTQSPGMQHCLPFSMWVLFTSLFGFRWLLDLIRNGAAQRAVMRLAAVTLLLIFMATFNRVQGRAMLVNDYMPSKLYPLHLDNFQNYRTMADTLEKLASGDDRILVLSSNDILSDDLVSTLTHGRIDSHLVYASQVDLRDRLRLTEFMARYVVVADPIQIHLHPEGQRVIAIPAQEILSGRGIGAAYRRTDMAFHLSNNVTATIFEKIRPFTPDEAERFIKEFVDFYPDWKGAYSTSLSESYLTANIARGDIWGAFDLGFNGEAIVAHPGEHSPTIVDWYFGTLHELAFRSTNTRCPTADGVTIQLAQGDGAPIRIEVPNGGTREVDVSALAGKTGRVVIDKNGNSACDEVEITAR
ncbi:hypothetical protein JUN65_01785 [Gluconacetobacter azotocaptans]|uniref:hypothetical protein n=1 Tax=Gluconacetobacter azotocaptans TaxID=142834 RepID=UPI00195D1307|nr:hypothetical protein [Gluconacetobacter azotocaptans]MBM9400323.1 hypothetical protein [Gluconacetobacter azotocaptans]